MKYFVLGIFLLIVAWDLFIYWNSKIKSKKALTERIPPIFEVKGNYFPIYGGCDIAISDFNEGEGLFQIQCNITWHNEPVRGFCTDDLLSFERKIRSEIQMVFDRSEDEKTDRTVKIQYCSADGSECRETKDIPLKMIITFFKPSNMDDGTKELLKQRLYPHLRDLVEIDWEEVNAVLKNCCTKRESLLNHLNAVSGTDADETGISDSTKNICRHLSMDMVFFYENQWFYGGGSSASVYENLKAKYIKIENRYLETLLHEYALDTVF